MLYALQSVYLLKISFEALCCDFIVDSTRGQKIYGLCIYPLPMINTKLNLLWQWLSALRPKVNFDIKRRRLVNLSRELTSRYIHNLTSNRNARMLCDSISMAFSLLFRRDIGIRLGCEVGQLWALLWCIFASAIQSIVLCADECILYRGIEICNLHGIIFIICFYGNMCSI